MTDEVGSQKGASPIEPFTLLDQLPDAVIVLDREMRCRFVNGAAERLTGRSRDDLVGHAVADVLPSDSAATFLAAVHGLSAAEEGSTFDWPTNDGTFELRISRVDGGVMIVARDVGAVRAREAEAAEKGARYQAIFEQSPIGIVVYDRDLRIVDCNDALARIIGVTRDRIVGLRIEELRDQRHGTAVRQALDGTTETFDSPYRATTSDRWVWVTSTFAPLHGSEGTPREVLVLVTDRTAELPRLAALRPPEALLGEAERVGRVGSWTWDAERGTIAASPEYYRILGIDPADDQMQLSELQALIHHEDRDGYFDRIDEAVTGRLRVSSHEMRIVQPKGDVRMIALRWEARYASDGRVVASWGTIQDITELRTLQEQFRHSQRMEAVGRLAGGVAHDFNNLLSVIKVEAELLDEVIPMREELREIQLATDRAVGLTRQLLAFSRKQLLRPRAVDVNEVVTEASQMLRRLIGEDVVLEISLAPSPLTVLADRGQLEQVLMNLAVNARDAMPKGGLLAISTELDSGGQILLTVRDNGHGMTREIHERIFEPFFTTKALGVGTGLGLSTVFGIIEQSGGHVTVETEPGKGAAFRITLPHHPHHDAPEPRRDVAEPRAVPSVATILLVEDEVALRGACRRILERRGHVVLEASDAENAVTIADAFPRPIDLLLTDMVMPGMNGRELYSRLRAKRLGLAVVYMTGYTDDEILRRGLITDDTTYLEKPFSIAELISAVRAAQRDASWE